MIYDGKSIIFDKSDSRDQVIAIARELLLAFLEQEVSWLHKKMISSTHLWVVSAAVSSEDMQLVSYSPNEDNIYKRVNLSWHKYLSKLQRFVGGFDISQEQIDRVAYLAGQFFDDKSKYSLKQWHITKIEYLYDNTPETCMTGEDWLLEFYKRWPNRFSLLAIYKDSRLYGRAIMFHTDQGKTVVGRIYPDHYGTHRKVIIEHAEQAGWDYPIKTGFNAPLKSGQTYTLTLPLDEDEDISYPYIDIFQCGVRESKHLIVCDDSSD